MTSLAKILALKRKDKFDLKYWIDYGFDVGYWHLMPKQYRAMPFYAYFDLDVHFALFSVVLLALLLALTAIVLVYKTLRWVARATCCKKAATVDNAKKND